MEAEVEVSRRWEVVVKECLKFTVAECNSKEWLKSLKVI
jgi:hypothetical protein